MVSGEGPHAAGRKVPEEVREHHCSHFVQQEGAGGGIGKSDRAVFSQHSEECMRLSVKKSPAACVFHSFICMYVGACVQFSLHCYFADGTYGHAPCMVHGLSTSAN